MTLTLHSFLLILALVSFFFAAINVSPPRVSLTPLGLFFLAAAFLLPG